MAGGNGLLRARLLKIIAYPSSGLVLSTFWSTTMKSAMLYAPTTIDRASAIIVDWSAGDSPAKVANASCRLSFLLG